MRLPISPATITFSAGTSCSTMRTLGSGAAMLSTTALETAFSNAAFWAAEWPCRIWTFKIGMTASDFSNSRSPAELTGQPSYSDFARVQAIAGGQSPGAGRPIGVLMRSGRFAPVLGSGLGFQLAWGAFRRRRGFACQGTRRPRP
ncbi:hypothetical protein G6F65_021987 [Rhizopus arrhizus]|nr:hypothetical protein G6F65_021987 [Rhizopus arrhizus]